MNEESTVMMDGRWKEIKRVGRSWSSGTIKRGEWSCDLVRVINETGGKDKGVGYRGEIRRTARLLKGCKGCMCVYVCTVYRRWRVRNDG